MHHRTYYRLRALDAWLMGVSTAGLAGFVQRLQARGSQPEISSDALNLRASNSTLR
jgi:hypothetical protein